MESLIFEQTKNTPAVNFNSETGMLVLEGKSIPENAFDFYKPVLKWIKKYAKEPHFITELHINMLYFNTSSSKCIIEMIELFEHVQEVNKELLIHWYYEEDDDYLVPEDNNTELFKEFTQKIQCKKQLVLHKLTENDDWIVSEPISL